MPKELNGRLPRRDFLVLPLLSILSAVTLVGITEISARAIWEAKEDSSCDEKTAYRGDRYRPNCTDRMKLAEGPWVESKYNECGYRSGSSCRAKPPRTIRVVLFGSSEAVGFLVPYQQTFAALSEKILTRKCGTPVEIQNLAVAGAHLGEQGHRVDEALALRPDAAIFLVTPGNMALDVDPAWNADSTWHPPLTLTQKYGLRADLLRLKVFLRQSTAFSMIRYYYYQDDQAYLNLQLKTYRDLSDVLRQPFSLTWIKRFEFLDSMLKDMAVQFQSNGIPFGLISSLSRPQAALLHSRTAFPELDPFAFDRQMAQIAHNRGILNFSVIDAFNHSPRPTSLFYIADGHMNASGSEVLAQSVTRQILEAQILRPAGCVATPDSDQLVMHQ